jgi:hypothetical protein
MTSRFVFLLVKENDDYLQRSLNQTQLLLIYAMNGCVFLSPHTQEMANVAILSQLGTISPPYNTALTKDTAYTHTPYYPYT